MQNNLLSNNINGMPIILAVISGLFLTFAFPLLEIDQIAWFSLVPLLFAIRNLSIKESSFLGFIAGFIHYITLLYWIVPTMNRYGNISFILCLPILFLLASYMALYIVFFIYILVKISSSKPFLLFIAPFLWVSLEYLRTFLFSGFPWALLGYSQINQTTLIQIVDITGIYGLSFVIIFGNIIILNIILILGNKQWQGTYINRKFYLIFLLVFFCMVGGVYNYGKQKIISVNKIIDKAPKTNISVIQGNIDQAYKWETTLQKSILKKHIELSNNTGNTDLIVWPETAVPFYFLYDTVLTKFLKQNIKKCNKWFIIGSPAFERDKEDIKYFNSAFIVDPQGNSFGRYDKFHLVPFGEYVPLSSYFPFLGKIVAQAGDFTPGTKGKTLKWKNNTVGIQTCFEIIFPNLSRIMVENGASIIINITNDAWFGKTSAPYQHFSMAVFRAIENRRTVVRAANTGISGFIDPVGQIIAKTPIFKEAVVTKTVPLLNELSYYTRFGDFFALTCITIVCAIFGIVIYIKNT